MMVRPDRRTLILTRREVQDLTSMEEAIQVVEQAFREKGEGRVQMPPKMYVNFDEFKGDFRVMPAYLASSRSAGVKIVNVHPCNPKEHGLPTVMATIILLEPQTGYPLCVMDGTWLTSLRTGAGSGVATKYLAKQGAVGVGFVGAGVQAKTQVKALSIVREINEVKVYDISPEARKKFIESTRGVTGARVSEAESVEEVASGVDVIVTTTPSTKPVLMDDHVSPGTHINAIGADAPGKQELDVAILKRAKVVVDDIEQASHSGEVQTCLKDGVIRRDDIYAELGDIVAGKKRGRERDDEITVFDSTGLAIQDVSMGWAVYRNALKKGVGVSVGMF